MKRYIILVLLVTGIITLCGCNLFCSDECDIVEDYASDFENILDEEDIDIGFFPPLMTGDDESDSTASGKLITRANYILNNLTETKYVHTNDMEIDEEKGIYKYDCSGFICEFLLKYALEDHYNDLYSNYKNYHSKDSRPRAWTFYDYFRDILGDDYDKDNPNTCVNQNQYWKVFTSVDSLKKGDIVVVRYHNDWRKKYKQEEGTSGSTGHVMIAWSVAYNSTGSNANNNDVDIKILDSSSSGHYWDTRNEPHAASVDGTGIGVGWMRYGHSSSASNRPYKYKWKLSSNNYYNLWDGVYNKYERLEGIIFARPI